MRLHTLIIPFVIAGLGTVLLTPQSWAQSGQPAEVQAVYACKTIGDSAERLACYDLAVGRLEAAEQSGDVVTVSKDDVENLERDAFGFNIPSLPKLGKLFGGGKKSATKKSKENPLTAPVESAEASESMPAKTSEAKAVTNDRPEVKNVEFAIRKTTSFGYDKTRFFFTNGQVWEQVGSGKIRIPKVRDGKQNTAEIRKASLGSFLLQINGKGEAIRVRRVR